MSIMAMGRILKTGGCFYYKVEKRGLVGGVIHPSQWGKKVRGGGGRVKRPKAPTYGPEHIYLNCGTKKN